MSDLVGLLRRMPKVELHCHLFGAMRPQTLAELTARNEVEVPDIIRDNIASGIFDFPTFEQFIAAFRLASTAARKAGDFARVVYETLEDGLRASNVRHSEYFFNPDYLLGAGIPYRTAIDGLVAGIEAAQSDLGVTCLLIPSIDRGVSSSAEAVEIVEEIAAYRPAIVVGIGLDGPENDGPPELFEAAYRLARKKGLRTTAHAHEDYPAALAMPASNYAIYRDVLGCERLDHGYGMIDDPVMTARAREEGVYFTCCVRPNSKSRLPARVEFIRKMVAAGLNVTINSDDPAMSGDNLQACYEILFDALAYDAHDARIFCLNGVRASWLEDGDKAGLLKSFTQQFDALAQSAEI